MSMLAGAIKGVATATPEKRMLVKVSMMNLQYNLSTYPGLLRDVSQLFSLLTDEAAQEVSNTISMTMDQADYDHVQAIFDDYRV
jgi:hypothetical protein